MEKPTYKVPDEIFLECLQKSEGNYSELARLITKKTGTPYTREAARHRAKTSFAEYVASFRGALADTAVATVKNLMTGKNVSDSVKLKAASTVLQHSEMGKELGFGNAESEGDLLEALPYLKYLSTDKLKVVVEYLSEAKELQKKAEE